MGYTIQYSPELNKRYPTQKKPKYIVKILIFCLVIAVVFVVARNRSALGRMLLPGDPEVTATALQGLVADIKAGNAGNAVATFCREIVQHAAG